MGRLLRYKPPTMHYEIREFAGYDCIFVVNPDKPIQTVVTDICLDNNKLASGYLVAYSDTTTGLWHGYLPHKGTVHEMGKPNQWIAINSLIKNHL